jgi:4-carboxymuconolactone decarboxylase
MRLSPIPPRELSAEQKPLADKIQYVVDHVIKGFVANSTNGALLGPFIPMLHFPQYGAASVAFSNAIQKGSTLSNVLRQIAILVTGAHFNARYEIYAHSIVAENAGLSPAKIATITAGLRPADLEEDESAVYDLTFALVKGGVISNPLYKQALKTFGHKNLAELIYTIGNYCLISIMLNTYDISVPEQENS